ncbi:hypothetical protein [Allomuricauda sp. d1]|uniref:hypothetical protein n=1 Tax=Allomuricauda sp. d1 TaxID=3136725 RepID=UPI0031D80EB8
MLVFKAEKQDDEYIKGELRYIHRLSYDKKGRPTKVELLGSDGRKSIETIFKYKRKGRQLIETSYNTIQKEESVTTNFFDKSHKKIKVIKKDDDTVTETRYTYDIAGNNIEVLEIVDGKVIEKVTKKYNEKRQNISVEFFDDENNPIDKYNYSYYGNGLKSTTDRYNENDTLLETIKHIEYDTLKSPISEKRYKFHGKDTIISTQTNLFKYDCAGNFSEIRQSVDGKTFNITQVDVEYWQ